MFDKMWPKQSCNSFSEQNSEISSFWHQMVRQVKALQDDAQSNAKHRTQEIIFLSGVSQAQLSKHQEEGLSEDGVKGI